jgi:hypothetical protein
MSRASRYAMSTSSLLLRTRAFALAVLGCVGAGACGGSAQVDRAPGGGAPGIGGAFATSIGGASAVAGALATGSGGSFSCVGATCNINCLQNEFLDYVSDGCCPVCRSQTPECLKGQAAYRDLYEMLLQEPGTTSCSTDDDCTLVGHFPKCGDLCAGSPASVAAATQITSELSQWADANCSSCGTVGIHCPAVHSVCVSGGCQLAGP